MQQNYYSTSDHPEKTSDIKIGKSCRASLFSIFFVFAFVSAVRAQQDAPIDSIPVADYQLIWQDEFNGTSLDTSKWRHRYPGPRRDAINHADAVSLDGLGHLILLTEQNDSLYYTGMIGTEGTFETTFGYFVCRAKLQSQIGHWSAFWLQSPALGQEIGNTATSGTEIDIFEYLRKEGDQVHFTLHWDGYKAEHKSIGSVRSIPGLSEGWHTFGLLWTAEEYIFYVDGQETWRTTEAISQRGQYLILSLEVGNWAGDIKKAALPDSFFVDYVRVYQQKEDNTGQ